MATAAKRATVYLNPDLHKALKLKAVETSRPVPDLVNDAIREALAEDAEDIAAFEERAGEPLTGYDETVKRLKKRWPDIRSVSRNPSQKISTQY
jgi:hypothetical protein